jgi:predicted nucleic acid-binding Zn ribbon protein
MEKHELEAVMRDERRRQSKRAVLIVFGLALFTVAFVLAFAPV